MMQTEPRLVNMDDWSYSGRGAQGKSYEHEVDKTILLKLYDTVYDRQAVEKEFELNQKLIQLGLTTPQAYELVTDGSRYGIIFQRIIKKKSYCRTIYDEPDRLKEMAKRFAAIAKDLHSKPFNNAVEIPTYKEYLTSVIVDNNSMPSRYRRKGEKLIASLPEATCYCHGDLQFGNVITDEKSDWMIDLSLFCKGIPEFDLAAFFHLCHTPISESIPKFFHISAEQAREFWKFFSLEYFGEKISTQHMFEKLEPCFALKCYWFASIMGTNPGLMLLKFGQPSLLKYI